jgi:hypothetical protein
MTIQEGQHPMMPTITTTRAGLVVALRRVAQAVLGSQATSEAEVVDSALSLCELAHDLEREAVTLRTRTPSVTR